MNPETHTVVNVIEVVLKITNFETQDPENPTASRIEINGVEHVAPDVLGGKPKTRSLTTDQSVHILHDGLKSLHLFAIQQIYQMQEHKQIMLPGVNPN